MAMEKKMKYGYRAQLIPDQFKLMMLKQIDIPSILDATDGFWINKEHKFTRGEDAKYWIPPSQILFVEKLVNVKE
jgi:hypothetical protein